MDTIHLDEQDSFLEAKDRCADDQDECRTCRKLHAHVSRHIWLLRTSAILNIFLLATILLLTWKLSNARVQESPDTGYKHKLNVDLKKTSSYSPLFDLVDLAPLPQKLNGHIHDNSSIYRRDPSPEVDAAWDVISAEGYEIILVDETAVKQSGKEPRLSIKAPLSWGRGDNAYVAQVDVFHQIHCLNELRKEIHFDYYYGKGSFNRSSLPMHHIEHKKHCIHILLQNLMCDADVDIITHNWIHYENINQPNRPYAEPLADFSIIKKCRDFGALLEWTQKNALDDIARRLRSLEMPDGAEFVYGDGYF